MKKFKLLLAAITIISLTACSTSQENSSTTVTTQKEKPAANPMAGYPAWVMDPNVEDGIGAVGSAFIGNAGVSFAKTEALANARDELARQLEVKVENMFKSYTNSIGVGGKDGVEKVATNVSKQIANQTLKNSRQVEMWISPEKELFIQVVIPKDIITQEAVNTINSDAPVGTSDRALWQEFKAKNSQEELDKAINKMLEDNKTETNKTEK